MATEQESNGDTQGTQLAQGNSEIVANNSQQQNGQPQQEQPQQQSPWKSFLVRIFIFWLISRMFSWRSSQPSDQQNVGTRMPGTNLFRPNQALVSSKRSFFIAGMIYVLRKAPDGSIDYV